MAALRRRKRTTIPPPPQFLIRLLRRRAGHRIKNPLRTLRIRRIRHSRKTRQAGARAFSRTTSAWHIFPVLNSAFRTKIVHFLHPRLGKASHLIKSPKKLNIRIQRRKNKNARQPPGVFCSGYTIPAGLHFEDYRIFVPIHHAIAATNADAGMVRTQAQTMLPATPQRTADIF